MFEYAVRNKLRWNTNKGILMAEDLWDLSLTALDDIYTGLCKIKREKEDASFSLMAKAEDKKGAKDMEVLTKKIDIVAYVFAEKQAAAEAKKREAERKAELQKLLTIKAQRDEKALENLSEEELLKKINELMA